MRILDILEQEQFIGKTMVAAFQAETMKRLAKSGDLMKANHEMNIFHFPWKRLWNEVDDRTLNAKQDFAEAGPFNIRAGGVYAFAFFAGGQGPTGPNDFTNERIIYIGQGTQISSRWARFIGVLSGKLAGRQGYYHVGAEKIRAKVAGDIENIYGIAPDGRHPDGRHEKAYENISIDLFIKERLLTNMYGLAANLPEEYRHFGEAVAMHHFQNADWNTTHQTPDVQGPVTLMTQIVSKVLEKT